MHFNNIKMTYLSQVHVCTLIQFTGSSWYLWGFVTCGNNSGMPQDF